MVTKGKVKKLYELPLLLTALELAALAMSEAETTTCGTLVTSFIYSVIHRQNADYTIILEHSPDFETSS